MRQRRRKRLAQGFSQIPMVPVRNIHHQHFCLFIVMSSAVTSEPQLWSLILIQGRSLWYRNKLSSSPSFSPPHSVFCLFFSRFVSLILAASSLPLFFPFTLALSVFFRVCLLSLIFSPPPFGSLFPAFHHSLIFPSPLPLLQSSSRS